MPHKHSDPKKSAPKQDTPDEELFRPDPTQQTLEIDPKTGHLIISPSRKRKMDKLQPAPLPVKKRDIATSPLRVPSPLPPVPLPHISPIPSPIPSQTPPPQDDEDDFWGGGDDEPLGEPDNNMPTNDPWDNYGTPDVPDTAHDDIYPSRPSPPEDTIGFTQLIHRAAQYHSVDLHTDPIEDFLMDTFAPSHRSTSILPMLKGVVRHAPEIFKDPVRARVINSRVEKK